MELAIIGAFVIGISLGLIGSGGSILTVPILVFVVGQDEKIAIAGSLAIVGMISAGAAIQKAAKGLVRWKSVALFAPPGMVGTYIGAWLSRFVSGETQLLLFAGVMFLVAFLMMRPEKEQAEGKERAFWKIAIDGLLVGIATGLVGVGGGFLIIPALVLLGGLQMKDAVGTSLVIIALKSAAGFWKYLGVLRELDLHLDWNAIGLFTMIGLVGSFCGTVISSRIPQTALRRAFGVLLVLMASYILWTHTPGKENSNGHSQENAQAETEPAQPALEIPEGAVRHWGAMREVLRIGRTEARVPMSEVSGRKGVIAVGALARLEGEITVLDGEVWLARGKTDSPEAGMETGKAAATLLVAAEVSSWNDSPISRDLDFEELDGFVRQAALDVGMDTARPFPFIIEGALLDVHSHVVNGGCPMVADLPPEKAPRRFHLPSVSGTLVGFYAEDAHGVLTHHGSSSHIHVLLREGSPSTGHVDSVAVKSGANLKLPASW